MKRGEGETSETSGRWIPSRYRSLFCRHRTERKEGLSKGTPALRPRRRNKGHLITQWAKLGSTKERWGLKEEKATSRRNEEACSRSLGAWPFRTRNRSKHRRKKKTNAKQKRNNHPQKLHPTSNEGTLKSQGHDEHERKGALKDANRQDLIKREKIRKGDDTERLPKKTTPPPRIIGRLAENGTERET